MQAAKTLGRLRICAGSSEPLVLADVIHVKAKILCAQKVNIIQVLNRNRIHNCSLRLDIVLHHV